jgi:hypothetical protein
MAKEVQLGVIAVMDEIAYGTLFLKSDQKDRLK